MFIRHLLGLCWLIWALPSLIVADDPPKPKFDLKDGDRIVLVGSSIIEREQRYGHVELMLHRLFPDERFIVRNLGWSGDTVFGDARAGFGSQQDGFKKLVEQVNQEKPTILICGYGTNEAYLSNNAHQEFLQGYERFLEAVKQPGLRLAFITPVFQDKHLIQSSAQLQNSEVKLRKACEAVSTLARNHQALLIDWSKLYETQRGLTDDGIIPNDLGYQAAAKLMADRQPFSFEGDELRKLIIKKNELYFHYYRPQNETYLFGFRKYEQGQNAKEVPQFSPLVAEMDRQINEQKRKEYLRSKERPDKK